ncbi:MAG: glycosyltransferase family 2 protein [Xanthomonadales bacterium]|jgi:glycosyltransferase involved in cell wall biosynthesis|nr:glycosyltransferase family 2 protein [Xanthomonadales bacterium]
MNPEARPRISVLIPVFNAESTLEECLGSVMGQSLESLEIVCVDDGSNDRSLEVLHGFQKADARIRIVTHARNQGEGAARNTGLDRARGHYVFHLDADDLLPPTALERLWRTAVDHNSQLVKGGFSMISETGETLGGKLGIPPDVSINTSLAESDFLKRIPGSHCSYLYQRTFLEEHGLRYRTDMSIGLDLVMLAGALTLASRVSLIPEVVYCYRQTSESATRGQTSLSMVREDLQTKGLVHDTLAHAGFEDAARDVLRRWDWHISAFWMSLPEDLDPAELKKVFQRWRSMIPGGFVPWTPSSPLKHRYFLTLILQRRHPEAIAFLEELRSGIPFERHEQVAQRCADVLALAPEDAEAALFAESQGGCAG